MTLQEFGVSYGYFLFNFLFVFVWFLFYFIRKDLRRELIWSSIILAPAGITGIYFAGSYWHPGTLFNLMNTIGFGVEDIIFSFFMGGIAGVCYEIFFTKKLRKNRTQHNHHLRLVPFLTMVFSCATLAHFNFNAHVMSLVLAAIMAALLLVFIRHDLAKEMLLGGILMALIYWFLGEIYLSVFPTYIQDVYNLDNLWGIYLWHVPFEEVLFGFAIGTVWAPFYEYTMGYKLTNYKTRR